MNLSKYRIILIVLIASMSLVACKGGCSEDNHNATITESEFQDKDVEYTPEHIGVSSEDTSMNNTLENADIMGTSELMNGTGSEGTTEVSLEGSTSEEIEDISKPSGENTTKPNSSPSGSTKPSGSTSVKATEAAIKVPETTKAQPVTTKPAQPTTTAPKPTQAPVQPTTAVSKPTQVPTQAPTQAPTEPPTEAYDPNYVISEVTRQLKAAGYKHMPDVLDEAFAEGRITQEEYNAWYPLTGESWFEYGCWEHGMDANIYELVESCKYLCVGNRFYIEYRGLDRDGYPIYRVYR